MASHSHQKYTAEQVVAAITQSRGLVSYTAQLLGCEEQTVRNYVKRYASVKDALDAARNRIVDLGELRLFQAVDAGEAWAVQYLLRSLGRDRGYGDRIDVTADITVQKEPQSLVIDYDEYNRAYREAVGIIESIGVDGGDATGDPPDD